MPKILFPMGGGGGGPAPADAPYLTDGAVAGLSAERNIQALTAELVWNRALPVGDVNEGINLFTVETTATGAFGPYAIAADILVNPAAASLAGPIGLKGTWRTPVALAFDVSGLVGDQPGGPVTGFATLDFAPGNGITTALFGAVGEVSVVNGTHTGTLAGVAGRSLMAAGVTDSLLGVIGAVRASGGSASFLAGMIVFMDCPAPGPTVTGVAGGFISAGSFFGTSPFYYGFAALDIATTPGNVADQRGVWVQNQTGGVVNWNLYVDTGGQSTLGSFASVGSNVGPFAAEQFRVVGDAYISGKLTVVGVIDPTAVILSDPAVGTALYLESYDGSGAAVSLANTGRLRYNDMTGTWQVSTQTSAYADLLTSFTPGYVQNGNSFGAPAVLGTNDAFSLSFETNNVTRMTLDLAGNVVPGGGDGTGAIGTDLVRWNRVRAELIIAGDLCFDDPGCAVCGKVFAIGERLLLEVVALEDPDVRARVVARTVPVHASCAPAP